MFILFFRLSTWVLLPAHTAAHHDVKLCKLTVQSSIFIYFSSPRFFPCWWRHGAGERRARDQGKQGSLEKVSSETRRKDSCCLYNKTLQTAFSRLEIFRTRSGRVQLTLGVMLGFKVDGVWVFAVHVSDEAKTRGRIKNVPVAAAASVLTQLQFPTDTQEKQFEGGRQKVRR